MNLGLLLMLSALLTASCAGHHAPPATVDPDAPRRFVIPFGARGHDQVCLDTAPGVRTMPCLPMRDLQQWLFSVALPNGAKL